jgi:uncharacterized protein YggE
MEDRSVPDEETPTVISNPSQPAASQPRQKPGLMGQLPLLLALVIIGGMLAVWQPWQAAGKAADRTISVTGEAEITATPDEYVFSPQYEIKNADKQAALAAATAKTNEIVAKLKALGVADSKIKTDVSGYEAYYSQSQNTYYTYLAVTVNDKALAQKVQDYLLTTSPTGAVTPQADFSQSKRKQLSDQGRDKATKDARSKAVQSARNLDFKLGKVKTFADNPDNFFDGTPLIYGANDAAGALSNAARAESAPIQKGENKLTYRIKVTYFLR